MQPLDVVGVRVEMPSNQPIVLLREISGERLTGERTETQRRCVVARPGRGRQVEKAREQGAEELVALRAAICTVRFQQRPDAITKIAEFKTASYDKDTVIKKFIADEKLATMVGENVPAAGAIDRCAYAISGLSR